MSSNRLRIHHHIRTVIEFCQDALKRLDEAREADLGVRVSGERPVTFRQSYLDAFTCLDPDDRSILHAFHFGFCSGPGADEVIPNYEEGARRIYLLRSFHAAL